MFKVGDLVLVGAGAALLTLGLVAAQARDARPVRAPEPIVAQADPVVAPAAQEKAQAGQAAAEKIVEAPCARRAKVVYAGYGEAERAACPGK